MKEQALVRTIIREMLKDIVSDTYLNRSMFFGNPYEDPGEEFLPDEDDPVGLVRAHNKINKELEIQGE